MADQPLLLIDEPAEWVRRITLNRPEKRNAISNRLRTELFAALEAHDRDENVRVTIIRGAGQCFSSGYDLGDDLFSNQPYYSAAGDGHWSRHVAEGWMRLWDLAKPVIAQVHGYAMAGGSELAAACDLVYVAEDARIGYPVVRMLSPPDMQFHPWMMGFRGAMEMMLTGDAVDGREAVALGLANRAWPVEQLDDAVLERACAVARIPADLNQINKRSVHRAMEVMGVRTAIRAGSELMALAVHQPSVQAVMNQALSNLKGVFDRPPAGQGEDEGKSG